MSSAPSGHPGYPAADRQAESDRTHLRLLSIFHYIYAGLTSIGGCVGLLYVIIGAAVASAPAPTPGPAQGQGDPQTMGAVFAGTGLLLIALCIGIAGLVVYAGVSIGRRRHRTYCLIIAGLICLSVPFGTVLGVFTLIVLLRPSVAALFEQSA